MIDSILANSVRARWLVLFLTVVVALAGAWQLQSPAHRCHAGHHQQAGADQHRGACPRPGGN
jgi:hypothetical protein